MQYGATKDTLIRRIARFNMAAIARCMAPRRSHIVKIRRLITPISYCVLRVEILASHARDTDIAQDRAVQVLASLGNRLQLD